MNTDTLYVGLKMLHLGALVLWLGPALGAWWMLRCAIRRFDDPGLVSHFLYRVFLRFVWLEHLALLVLLASGLALAGVTQALSTSWLQYKLLLVAIIVIPLEIVDIWYSHVRIPAILRLRHPSRNYTPAERTALSFYHRRFTPAALLVLPGTLIAILWLALGKPG